jgi:type II secretory pathway component PulM
MNDTVKPPVLDEDEPVKVAESATAAQPELEQAKVQEKTEAPVVAVTKEDGIDKALRFMGMQPKDKKFVMIGAAALVAVLVFNVFGNRQRIADISDEGVEQVGRNVVGDRAQGAMIILLDPDMLIKASVGQSMASASADVKPVDTAKLGSVIRETVRQYRDEGYIIINKSAAMAFPGTADLTPVIAKKAGINLEYAELDVFTGKGGPEGNQGNGPENQ